MIQPNLDVKSRPSDWLFMDYTTYWAHESDHAFTFGSEAQVRLLQVGPREEYMADCVSRISGTKTALTKASLRGSPFTAY